MPNLPPEANRSRPDTGGLSVVLPAYNEEANIGEQVASVVGLVRPLVADLEVIVVNDGSRDRTRAIVHALAREWPFVKAVDHPTNRGYGAALLSGFMAAQKPWIFVTDADRQFDPGELGSMLPHTAQYDMVIGYRSPRRDPIHRRVNGWGWNLLTRLLLGSPARDVDCAFKLFKREIVDRITIQSRGATFSAELVVRAARGGYRIHQVPVVHRPRIAGSPTGGRPDVIRRAFRELVILRLALWREDRAGHGRD